jgi:hypothetical protein
MLLMVNARMTDCSARKKFGRILLFGPILRHPVDKHCNSRKNGRYYWHRCFALLNVLDIDVLESRRFDSDARR